MLSVHASLLVQASRSSQGSVVNTNSQVPTPSHSKAAHSNGGSPHDVPCGNGVPPPHIPPVQVCQVMHGLFSPQADPSGSWTSAGQFSLAPLQNSAGLQSNVLRHRTLVEAN